MDMIDFRCLRESNCDYYGIILFLAFEIVLNILILNYHIFFLCVVDE